MKCFRIVFVRDVWPGNGFHGMGWSVCYGYSPSRQGDERGFRCPLTEVLQYCNRDTVVWTASIIEADFRRRLGNPTAAREYSVTRKYYFAVEMGLLRPRPQSTPVSKDVRRSTATGEHPLGLLCGIAVEIELLGQRLWLTRISKVVGIVAARRLVSIIL